jgi:hypothetical protein
LKALRAMMPKKGTPEQANLDQQARPVAKEG